MYGIVLLVNHSYLGYGATTAVMQQGGDGHMYHRKATKHSPFRIVFEKKQSPQDRKKWVKQYRHNGYDAESAAEEQRFLEDGQCFPNEEAACTLQVVGGEHVSGQHGMEQRGCIHRVWK